MGGVGQIFRFWIAVVVAAVVNSIPSTLTSIPTSNMGMSPICAWALYLAVGRVNSRTISRNGIFIKMILGTISQNLHENELTFDFNFIVLNNDITFFIPLEA